MPIAVGWSVVATTGGIRYVAGPISVAVVVSVTVMFGAVGVSDTAGGGRKGRNDCCAKR